MRFVRITRGSPGVLNSEGLEVLRMALWDRGREVNAIRAYSGAPGRQNFRTLAQERRGVLEPCPEGVYRQIGPLEWAGQPGDYSASWAPGLGPVVIEVYGERAIMIHLDANRDYAPGSAGCLCPVDLPGLQSVVAWWQAGRPEWVECDWGLGTVGKPGSAPELHRVKIFGRPGKSTAYRDGSPQEKLAVRLEHSSGLAVAINGVQLLAEQIESVSFDVAYRFSVAGNTNSSK